MYGSIAHRATPPILLAAALAVAGPAWGQKAGTYNGTNNEGYNVQVVVQAASGGGFNLVGMADAGATYCHGASGGVWSVAIGTSQPISNGGATLTVFDVNLYYSSTMTFHGNEVRGTIKFVVPEFNSTTQAPPKKACAAATKTQHFTAKLGGAAMSVTPGAVAWPVKVTR